MGDRWIPGASFSLALCDSFYTNWEEHAQQASSARLERFDPPETVRRVRPGTRIPHQAEAAPSEVASRPMSCSKPPLTMVS